MTKKEIETYYLAGSDQMDTTIKIPISNIMAWNMLQSDLSDYRAANQFLHARADRLAWINRVLVVAVVVLTALLVSR